MKTTINYFSRMLCVFLLSAGVALTSCDETDAIDDNKTEQGGNENNGNEGGDENSGNGNEGGENTGGDENEDKGPATMTLDKVTATTATFTGHLDVPASDLSFSKVSIYYSSSETFNVNNAKLESTTEFDSDQNFTIRISQLKSNTQYNYCVVAEIKSEKIYGDITNFTTTEIGVSLTPKESNIISGSPIAEFNVIVTGLTEEDKNTVGVLFSSSEDFSSDDKLYPTITSEGSYTIKTKVLETDSKYYYCYYIGDSYGKAYIYGDTEEINTTHPYSVPADLDMSSANNLSSSASANSYIVSESGLFKIKTVKGNSNTPVGNAVSGSILWECIGERNAPDFNELITGVSYKDGYLAFQVAEPFKEGNALIAVKDSENKILWSWHIWLTDEPQCHTYSSGSVMMDRNLGATSTMPGEPCYGLLYQWGRKDPFPGTSVESEISTTGISIYGTSATTTFDVPAKVPKADVTTDYATANPMTLFIQKYMGGGGSYSDSWYYDGETMAILWQESKTIYDPCPAGWKVPTFYPIASDKEIIDQGLYFKISSSSTAFYPFLVMYDNAGDFDIDLDYSLTISPPVEDAVLYWRSKLIYDPNSIDFYIFCYADSQFEGNTLAKEKLGHAALPVRCIKE